MKNGPAKYIALLLVIVLSLTLLTGCGKKDEPAAVQPQQDLQIDSGGDGTGLTPYDNGSSEYNIPAGSVIIDEDETTVIQEESSDGVVIIDEEASAAKLPDGTVVIEEEEQSSGTKSKSGYNIPEGSVIIDEPSSTKSPKPTASPVSPVSPSGAVLASGTMSSNTGTSLNLVSSWSVTAVNDSTVSVTVYVSIASGALQCKAVAGSVTVGVNNSYTYLNAPAINVSGGSNVTDVGSATFSVNVPVGSGAKIPMSVSWRFGGTYSGVSIDTIVTSDSVTIKR